MSLSLFADPFSNAEKIAADFLNNGTVIKVIEKKNTISFITKSSVCRITVDENDIEIATANGHTESYNIALWNIQSDEKGNIIIFRK